MSDSRTHYNPYLLPPPPLVIIPLILPLPVAIMAPPSKKSTQVHSSIPESILSTAQAAAMNAAVLRMLIGTAPLGANVLGQVDARMPNTMVLNEDIAALTARTGIRHTVPHEFEHVLQNRAASRYNATWDSEVLAEYNKLGGSTDKLIANLERSAASVPLRERIQSLSGSTPAAYIGGLPGKQFSLREQFAELSSLEAYSGKDLTKDPIVRKEFFGNDEALIATYRATTGLRQERLDARDLPPMTATPPARTVTTQQQQQPATAPKESPSVLDQILDAAKRLMK